MTPNTPGDTAGRTCGHGHPAPVTSAQLKGITQDLRSDVLDAPAVLRQVWAGVRAARLLGLRLALVDRVWQQRQVNAESVEHQLTQDFRTSATFAGAALALPCAGTPEPLAADAVEPAVEALVEFSGVARERMLAVAGTAEQWHDERVLRHDSLVVKQLAAAWLGERASYRVEVR